MRRKLNKILVLCIIFVLLFSCSFKIQSSFAESESIQEEQISDNSENIVNEESSEEKDYEAQMQDLEDQKDNLENAIVSNQARIGVVEGILSESLEEIQQLSTKIEQKRSEISNLEIQELSLNKLIEEEEAELEELNERYEQEKKLLEKRLVIMYEMGNITTLDVLFNSKDISDFLSRYYLLGEIGKADQKLINNVKKDKTRTASIAKSLNEKKNELEKDKEEKEKYEISLNNMEILKNNKINSLNEEEIKLNQEIENFRQEIANLESEIKEIALKNLGQKYIGGKFIWPAPGYNLITSPFGLRTHPITGIYKLHTGMDIGAPMGANFVAANDGVVVKAGYNSAYGNMVMIDHGGGVITLYAHGNSIEVQEGDIVKQGQTVLKVGSTGYSTGPHAHFEIIINGQYLNPADYITPDNGDSSSDIENITVVLN